MHSLVRRTDTVVNKCSNEPIGPLVTVDDERVPSPALAQPSRRGHGWVGMLHHDERGISMGGETGQVAPDGSPVAIYLALAAEPTFTPVLDHLPPGASVLDLGCGVGRLANVLVDRGHTVTAVDEAAAMLVHVDDRAERIQARIEDLDLPRTFDVVVLASHMINSADAAQRRAFLATVRRHLASDGEAYLQHHDVPSGRYEPGTTRERLPTPAGELDVETTVHERRGCWLRATTTMTLDDVSWAQHYEAELLGDEELGRELRASGLRVIDRPTATWTVAGRRA